MPFKYGMSRLVFCVGPLAIKVARVKIFFYLGRLLYWRKHGGAFNRLRATHPDQSVSTRIASGLLIGVIANIEEWQMDRRYGHLIEVGPVYFSIFGLVNISPRATPLIREELALAPFRDLARTHSPDSDLNKIENFGRINGEIRLLDCGNPALNRILAEYADTRQAAFNLSW
jgi:hypothetical protein